MGSRAGPTQQVELFFFLLTPYTVCNERAQVVDMKAQLQEKSQRHHLLTEQLITSEKVIAAHTINDPEFNERKAEHESLMSKIASIR